jgi:Domain of unknown function (DUF4440)
MRGSLAMLLAICASLQIGLANPEQLSKVEGALGAEVVHAERRLVEAVARRHEASVEGMIADDARITAADGEFLDESGWVEHLLENSPPDIAVPARPDVRLYRNMALVHGRATIRTTGADSTPRERYVLRAWVDVGDTWQLAVEHNTDITAHATAVPPTFAVLDSPIPAGPTDRAPDASARPSDITEALRESHRRYWAKDVDGYRRTIGTDLIRSAETGVRPGSELVAFMQSNPRLPARPPDQLEMWARVFGSVAIGGWLDLGPPAHAPASRNRFTVALVWRDGRWQIVHIQSTGVTITSAMVSRDRRAATPSPGA